MEAAFEQPTDVSIADDARAVAWWVLVGAAAGAIAGFVVGGIGGRLAMLLLRLTSPDSVIGVSSDDGFVIGQVTFDTVNLAFAMAMLGGINGVLYGAFRTAIPVRLRLPLWTILAALVGGSLFVHDDGVDFNVLEPALLAIALFVALPGIAAAVVVLLVERWSRATPWADRRLTALIALAALASTFALVLAAVVIALAVAVRRLDRLAGALHRIGPVLVPLAVAIFGVIAGVDLVQESRRILD
jgi:hypothetical protein